jgi:hypothetical protein
VEASVGWFMVAISVFTLGLRTLTAAGQNRNNNAVVRQQTS